MTAGLQSERTRLAWRRTVLTTTVVGLLAARLSVQQRAWLGLVVVIVGWLAVLVAAHLRIRALAARRLATAGPAPFALVLTIVGYALLGAALAAGMQLG